jgi:hypothetical protein
MGMEVTAFLGPYIEYTVRVTTKRVSRCPEPMSCPKPTEGFCQRCGKKATNLLETVEEEEPYVDVVGDYEEALGPINYFHHSPVDGRRTHRCLMNELREGHYDRRAYWDAKRGEEAATNVDPEQIRAETEWFKKAFAPELADLQKRCGPDNVHVRWGLLIYCS